MENNLQNPVVEKYNLAERLDRCRTRQRLHIRKSIIAKFNISASTYDRWLKLKQSDSADIPGEPLIAFALLLGVSVPELLNRKSWVLRPSTIEQKI